MKKLEQIEITLEEAEALKERALQGKLTDKDKKIVIDTIKWFSSTWWTRFLFKVYGFALKIDKLLGIER